MHCASRQGGGQGTGAGGEAQGSHSAPTVCGGDSGGHWRQDRCPRDCRRATQGRDGEMLWRRHHAETQTAREAERGKETHEVVWVGEHTAGGVYSGAEGLIMAKPENREPKREVKEQRGQGPVVSPAPGGPASRRSPVLLAGRWFLYKIVRQANAMRKHVQKLLNHQRDMLTPQAVGAIQGAIGDLHATIRAGAEQDALEAQMENLERTATKWLKPYPSAAWRENVEVLLVALTVAMGIRTFILQPFKIPTGSMQPTLYGVTSTPDFSRVQFFDPAARQAAVAAVKIPTGWQRIREWFEGISYLHEVAESDGELTAVDPPIKFLIFNIKQTFYLGGKAYTIWFPPDYGESSLEARAGLRQGDVFHAGDDILKIKVSAGDHLFVDRVSYNFCPPDRGEIIVFQTDRKST